MATAMLIPQPVPTLLRIPARTTAAIPIGKTNNIYRKDRPNSYMDPPLCSYCSSADSLGKSTKDPRCKCPTPRQESNFRTEESKGNCTRPHYSCHSWRSKGSAKCSLRRMDNPRAQE